MSLVRGRENVCHLQTVSCLATIKVERFSYKWIIPNYSNSSCYEIGSCMESPRFTSGTKNDKGKWRLRLYPTGETMRYKDYVALYLVYEHNEKSSTWAKFGFSLLVNKTKYFLKETETFKEVSSKPRWGYIQFISRDVLLAAGLVENNLTIICNVSVFNSFDDNCKASTPAEMSVLKDMGCLFESKQFPDVTLFVDGKEFAKVHRAILSARSAVFHAMIANDVKMEQENRVDIKDMAPEVVQELLRFIYTGKVENSGRVAERLLPVADKFSLADLKNICGETLAENLSIGNVAYFLILADRYALNHLKAEALQFITNHSAEVSERDDFLSMAHINPQLMVEAFRAAVSRDVSNSNKRQQPKKRKTEKTT